MTRTDDLSELKRLAEAAQTCSIDGTTGKVVSWHPLTMTVSSETILSLIARLEAAEARVKVLEDAGCARPANTRPDDWTIRQCNDAEECGCVFGRALITPKPDEPTTT